MKVLITGVAGLIGSRLADWLIENVPEARVVGLDNLSGGFVENIHPSVEFVKLDLADSAALGEVFEKFQPDYVFHLAAYAAEGLSPFIRNFNYCNNLVNSANVINECIRHNTKRLIFTSTLAVYGHGYGGVFDEDHIPKPIDPYGVAKYACEMDIQIAGEQHGLDWCIIRPHNVYGIKQNIWDKYRNVLGIWMNQHLDGQPLTIYGDGLQTRAFSYIDDSLKSLWTAAVSDKASKQIINLGGTAECSIKDACLTLIDVMGGGLIEYKESRHEVKHSIPTYQKSIDLLDFEHKTSLRDGLSKMWEWAKSQPRRGSFIWPAYELDSGIYSFWKNMKPNS
jgi:UDP-glucose 4-epimerase